MGPYTLRHCSRVSVWGNGEGEGVDVARGHISLSPDGQGFKSGVGVLLHRVMGLKAITLVVWTSDWIGRLCVAGRAMHKGVLVLDSDTEKRKADKASWCWPRRAFYMLAMVGFNGCCM